MEEGAREIRFGSFRLDIDGGRLLRGGRAVPLRRKAWEVLCFLAARRGAIVSGEELLGAVWPGVAVTPQTVTNVIHELRVALDDGAGASRWIQTVQRRGHVFLPWGDATLDPARSDNVVARVAEVALLSGLWLRSREGHRQIAVVVGESGIGKTTIVEEFRRQADAASVGGWESRSCALENRGRYEAYQPLLSAIEQLAVGPHKSEVRAALRSNAPTWLFQMPRLLRADERIHLESALAATSSGRMLREGVALIRELATARPLLLVLEDLHWADDESLDFVGALARDPTPIPLFVVLSCRPSDPAMREYRVMALARTLLREQRAVAIGVEPFDEAGVSAYLESRLGGGVGDLRLSERLLHQSSGNPLFLRALVDELLEREVLVRSNAGWEIAQNGEAGLEHLPDTLRKSVQLALAALPAELRTVVEAASVVGGELTAPEAAAASGFEPDAVEDACERLAAGGRLLKRAGDAPWVDGGSIRRYSFPHATHEQIIYEGLPPIRRRSMHRRLALVLEATTETPSGPSAARLAFHFDRAGLPEKAAVYFEHAAANADAAHCYREAADHVQSALEKLDGGGMIRVHCAAKIGELHMKRGSYLVLANGYSTPEVEKAYSRARDAFAAVDVHEGRLMAEVGLCAYHLTRAQYAPAREASDRLLASSISDASSLGAIAGCWAGFVASALGDLDHAHAHLVAGLALPAMLGFPRNFDTHRMIRSQLAIVLAVKGELEQAREMRDSALRMSAATGLLPDLAHAKLLAAEHAVFSNDREDGPRHAAEAVAIADENDLKSYSALARAYDAYLREDRPRGERIETMRGAITARRELGDLWHESMLLALVADLEISDGQVDAAHADLEHAAAHVNRTGERHYEAEIARLRGECLLAGRSASAESRAAIRWFERSLRIADRQGARLWRRRGEASIERAARPRSAVIEHGRSA